MIRNHDHEEIYQVSRLDDCKFLHNLSLSEVLSAKHSFGKVVWPSAGAYWNLREAKSYEQKRELRVRVQLHSLSFYEHARNATDGGSDEEYFSVFPSILI